ncbi:MAG: DUF1501 domain-containing protein [SAR324 cluster bacterium]|nr:DUF1501 domain-containing protein [SAR324 cluster bacterium]
MKKESILPRGMTRRDLLRAGLYGLGVAGLSAAPLPPMFGRVASALAAQGGESERIFVVFEVSGGNDGLNTVVPYGDDAYYRQRPNLGIRPGRLRKLDDHFGLNDGMAGFERLYKDGRLGIVHGCGYENPSFSHFTSMAYWHTAAPNSGSEYGWMGRLADSMLPAGTRNAMINVAATQSLAVRSRDHVPVVFDEPDKFAREGFFQERPIFDRAGGGAHSANPSRRFLHEIAQSAKDASLLVKDAWSRYRSPVDYGIVSYDLDKVAALIEAGMPTRLYYTGVRNNAFDTHVFQANLHGRLLTYVSDAVSGFLRDMERIGRADDVVVLLFSEFGRRVPENTNLGTDHGAAGLMFVAGKPVRGGHYGDPPSLTDLDEGDNLVFTTDFRRVYATVIDGWLGYKAAPELLGGEFEPFPMFA